ncbi:MAG: hypothetical protein AB7G76_04205 [Steroidobacteraceae bacterium]
MHRFRFGAHLVWILCFAFFAARVGGAHLHLCLDGLEAPVAVHVEGHSGEHPADEAGQSHNDVDVPIVAEALVKQSKAPADTDGSALFAILLLFPFAPRAARIRRPRARTAAATSPPRFFLPPAHAPPR